ncbi:uncharacterized protein B0T23DRAFT_412141 [Neurospora hispaniola]|uniref:Uncharacterized protein n=1 Tax=Neurospora hispaniola TaxID=588809 RepID=A0AAJ0IB53_9PEZI|nr:hypothetical protein B0T23DRAFT_412141 [Neurospora hispaniola]
MSRAAGAMPTRLATATATATATAAAATITTRAPNNRRNAITKHHDRDNENMIATETTVTEAAQPTTASVTSKKEEKGTKAEKQKLERPSWIETKKEATTTTNTKRPAKEVEDLAAQKGPEVEEVRPRRAFSFHQTEKKKAERAEKATHVEEIRFSAPIRKDDEKKGGFVAGLATKFGSTKKAEDMPNPKKDIPLQVEIQPLTSTSTSTHRTFLHLPTEEKLNTPPPPVSPPTTEEKKNINPVADDYFSHSHWSIRDDSKQESDAELAQRLANTEKIFRQQEQKIQAALDRIRDLERQLASGFTATATGGEQDDDEEVQTETGTKTWDNESIAAGGRESGPHFRQLHGNSSKGPLPCFSGDEPHFRYRVLTVNSHKPQVNKFPEQRHHLHHEDIVIDNSDDNSRTPSPIAVTFNIPSPKPAASLNPPYKRQQLPTTKTANFLDPITKSPQSFVLQSLKHEPTPSSVKTTTTTATRGPKKHKPLPLLPTDARAIIPVRQQTPKQTNLPPLRVKL